MIRHVVMIRWKPEFEQAARQDWLDRVLALPGKISAIRSLSAGTDVLAANRSWDVALVADFDSVQDIAGYTAHPDHQPLIAISTPNAESVASVDFAI